MPGVGRLIVGTSGSPGSLNALRYAEGLARAHGAVLIPVLAWDTPGGDYAVRARPSGQLLREWQVLARQRLRDALIAVWGEVPGDVLIVGAGRRGALARMVFSKVSRYCLAHAQCPVLAIPPPPLARELRHSRLAWKLRHRPLTAEQILSDQPKPAA